jgi:hypothetical protein
MERTDFFKKYYFYDDKSLFVSIAKSIITIESLFGTIPNVHLHGNISKVIFESGKEWYLLYTNKILLLLLVFNILKFNFKKQIKLFIDKKGAPNKIKSIIFEHQ